MLRNKNGQAEDISGKPSNIQNTTHQMSIIEDLKKKIIIIILGKGHGRQTAPQWATGTEVNGAYVQQ